MAQEISDETTFLDLTDDCLGEMCKYLSNHDQVAFALSYPRFKSVFKLYCKVRHSFFKVNDTWSRAAFEKYFQLAGSLITHIDMDSDEQEIEDLVIKYCPNVESIDFTRKCFDLHAIEKFKNLVKNFTWFHALTFFYCDFEDDVLEAITELQTIDELTIEGNALITGKHLSRLKTLKLLSLEQCCGIDAQYLYEIPMRELHTLELQDCDNVDAICLYNLSRGCPNLKRLTFTCYGADDYRQAYKAMLLHLPGLVEIHVIDCTDDFLEALAEHQSDQMESLTLIYEYDWAGENLLVYDNDLDFDYRRIAVKYPNLKELSIHCCLKHISYFIPMKELKKVFLTNCSVGTAGILQMLRLCPQLVYISIDDNQAFIGMNLIREAVKVLRETEYRERPVQLLVEIHGLTGAYLETSAYRQNRHLLQLPQYDFHRRVENDDDDWELLLEDN